jgi:hypothetical protein
VKSDTSGRSLVERRAKGLRRGWLRRRNLRARDLSPAAADLLTEWSEAAARLKLGDERGEFGDKWQVAAQNSAARLAARLENAVGVERDPVEEMRELLSRPADEEEPADEFENKPEPEPADLDLSALLDGLAEAGETSIDVSGTHGETMEPLDPPPAPQTAEIPHVRARSREPLTGREWFSEKSRRGVGGLPRQF